MNQKLTIFVSLFLSFLISSFIYNFLIKKRPPPPFLSYFYKLKAFSYRISPSPPLPRSFQENFFLPSLSPNIVKKKPQLVSPTTKLTFTPTIRPTFTPTIRPTFTPKPLPSKNLPTQTVSLANCTPVAKENYQSAEITQVNPDPISQRRDLYLPPHYLVDVEMTVLNIPIYNPDPNVPLFYTIFKPPKTPRFVSGYKAEGEIQGPYPPAIDILEVETKANESLYFPKSGYNIGGGLAAIVIYADENRVTFKIGREDSIVTGYTLYFENLCVDKNLISLYQKLNNEGRKYLPAIYPQQFFGLTRNRLKIAIRDTGMFLDLRINGVIDEYKIWR